MCGLWGKYLRPLRPFQSASRRAFGNNVKQTEEKREQKKEKDSSDWRYTHWLPPLQGMFFGVTIVGIVANLAYQSLRDLRAQEVAAIKLSFGVMTDSDVKVLRRLVTGQPALSFFRVAEKPLGRYRGVQANGTLDRIEAILALQRRARHQSGVAALEERVFWRQVAGPENAMVLPVAHDTVRESILFAIVQLGHFDHLIQSKTMSLDMVPPEMQTLMEQLGGTGKFKPQTEMEELFLTALHDFCSRRQEAEAFFFMMKRLSPGWEPREWTSAHDRIAYKLYTNANLSKITINDL